MGIHYQVTDAAVAFYLVVQHPEGHTTRFLQILLYKRYPWMVHARYPVTHITCDGYVVGDTKTATYYRLEGRSNQ